MMDGKTALLVIGCGLFTFSLYAFWRFFDGLAQATKANADYALALGKEMNLLGESVTALSREHEVLLAAHRRVAAIVFDKLDHPTVPPYSSDERN